MEELIRAPSRMMKLLRVGRLGVRWTFLWLVISAPAVAKDIHVTDISELERAVSIAKPGDNLVLRQGEWPDTHVVLTGNGTAAAPITLKAAVPGKTIFTGTSSLRIGGQNLVVEGLLFDNPSTEVSDLIQFRQDSKHLAHHCRLTNCAVIGRSSSESSKECRWVGLYGEGHRVDRCSFEGKSGPGATFVVWLSDESNGKHRIDHNYFGPREKLGKNGGETIRIGDSQTSMRSAECIVEHNLFERCNGEVECISNKSCGNVYRDNTFLRVSGTLTLRHGNNCLVQSNAFLGGGVKGSGGIRIIGEGHVVRDNYLEKLAGDDARSAISLMMGIPNSPLNRYFQVRNARIENNTIVDCKNSILIGLSDDKLASLPPVETTLIGNRIVCTRYTAIEARCDRDGIRWVSNQVLAKTLGIPAVVGIDANRPAIETLAAIPRHDVGTTW